MTAMSSPMRFICCFAAVLVLPLAAARALDLTPHSDFRRGNESPPIPVLQFTDGTKKITWQPPSEWLPDGGGKSLSLTAPGSNGAWMKLLVVRIVKEDPQPVTDPAAPAEKLQEWAMHYMPAGAQDVTFVKMVPSPFTVCTHQATEYIFTLSRYGAKETVSISAVDFSDTERLVVIFAAGKDFDKVRQTVIGSMFDWQYQ